MPLASSCTLSGLMLLSNTICTRVGALELVLVVSLGATMVGVGTCTQVALIVALTVAPDVTLALVLPLQVSAPRSKLMLNFSVAGATTCTLLATPTVTSVDAVEAGPLPDTTCACTLARVPAGTELPTTFTVMFTVARCANWSTFHHEKCVIVARNASPVGEAGRATTVPLPSCTHNPVALSSVQNGIVSPTWIGVPSSKVVA